MKNLFLFPVNQMQMLVTCGPQAFLDQSPRKQLLSLLIRTRWQNLFYTLCNPATTLWPKGGVTSINRAPQISKHLFLLYF